MTSILTRSRCLLDKHLLDRYFHFRQAGSLLAKSARPSDYDQPRAASSKHKKAKKVPEPELTVDYQQSERDYLASRKALTSRFSIDQADKPMEVVEVAKSTAEETSVKSFLKKHRELAKSQAEPMHLTILDEAKAEEMAKSVLSRTSGLEKSCERVFIDLQPGACLVSKHLVKGLLASGAQEKADQKLTSARMVLIEPLTKYSTYHEQLKSTYGDKIQIDAFKGRPFEFDFMFNMTPRTREIAAAIRQRQSKEADEIKSKRRCVFFGVLPWNRMGYLTKLFTNFASDSCLFSLRTSDDEPHEFFLYIPELVLAKLVPDRDKSFEPFRSAYSIYASQFLKTFEIIDTSSADHFYPYPIMKTPYKFSMHPYDKLDMSKLHLVRMVFKARHDEFNFASRSSDAADSSPSMATVPLKYLFYLFVQEIYQRPKYTLIKVLKDVFRIGKQSKERPNDLGMKDHEYIAKLCSEVGINSYSAVKKLTPHQCLAIFNAIISDSKTSTFLDYLVDRGRSAPRKESELRSSGMKRQTYLKALMASNQQMKGQLVVPTVQTSELE